MSKRAVDEVVDLREKKARVAPYDLVYNGEYEAAKAILDEASRERLNIVRYLETRVDGESVTDSNEVYRGYSAETEAEIQAILDDPTPFDNYNAEGAPKNEKYDLLETYFGCYVSRDKDKAEGYSKRHEHGLLVTFDWRDLRARYVTGEIDFEQSNDIAWATEDFTDLFSHDIVGDLRDAMPPDHPLIANYTDEEFEDFFQSEENDEAIKGMLYDPEIYVPWSFLFGRNKELAINGIEEWSWANCKSYTRLNQF